LKNGVRLPMQIVPVPCDEKKSSEVCSDYSASPSGQREKESPDDIVPIRFYVRRNPETSGYHAKDCPNTLRFRDKTKILEGERRYPLSIFGVPRSSLSKKFGFHKDGAVTGKNLGDFSEFCNHVTNAAADEAVQLAGKPFGTPSPQLFFKTLYKQIRGFNKLTRAEIDPFQAAEDKSCRLEFGICEYTSFGVTVPFQMVEIPLLLTIACQETEFRQVSYFFSSELLERASDQVRRYKSCISPPYLWIGIVSDQRIVRYWQWPVVFTSRHVVLTDSNPESEFVMAALWRELQVFKPRNLDVTNALLRTLVPEAGPILSSCDFLLWDGRLLTIVEVVKRDEAENEKDYWKRLKDKETQKGGYLDLQIADKLVYERVDMRLQSDLGRTS